MSILFSILISEIFTFLLPPILSVHFGESTKKIFFIDTFSALLIVKICPGLSTNFSGPSSKRMVSRNSSFCLVNSLSDLEGAFLVFCFINNVPLPSTVPLPEIDTLITSLAKKIPI